MSDNRLAPLATDMRVSHSTMLFGAALSAIVAALAGALSATRRSQPRLLATMALTALLGPLAWNCILRTTGTTANFSHDLPFKPFPISWQDTGSGVFALAVAFTALSMGVAAHERPRHVAALSATAALAALLVWNATRSRRSGSSAISNRCAGCSPRRHLLVLTCAADQPSAGPTAAIADVRSSPDEQRAAEGWPSTCTDPFDRLLVSRALVERLTVRTADAAFTGYAVPVFDART